MRAALAISLLLLCGAGSAQKVRFSSAGETEVVSKAIHPPASNQERAEQLKAWFEDAGCAGNALHTEPVDGAQSPNIICELKGKSSDTIVIGAHYDLPSSPARPFDDWSGAALLASLYHCLSDQTRRHTIIFAAFADNGNHAQGAEELAGRLKNVSAMLNLDALGLSPPKVWTSHSDKQLVQEFMTMVYALKIPASQVDIDLAGSTDSQPFAARGVPEITVHSLTRQNLLSRAENKLNARNYYNAYRLLCGYVAYLGEKRDDKQRGR
ncbi:MAG TPA: M28 family peptidase [Terriglobales bacterium]|nr:M28 family peptidase [Terriglobales bacterium]